MFNSEALEVATGMTFLFLMMSLICTGIKEWIEGILKWRAMDLENAVRTLLDDKSGQLAAYFYSHPLISALYQGHYDPSRLTKSTINRETGGDAAASHMPLGARRNLPSYIPSELFAKALIDIVGRGPADVAGEHTASEQLTVAQLQQRAVALASPCLRRIVLSGIDHCGGDLKQLTLNLQNFFDGAMDRASGWYKRRTQAVLFGLGLAASVVLNIDALHVMHSLTTDKTLREAFVNAAAKAPEAMDSAAANKDGLSAAQKVRDELKALQMPMGWQDDPEARIRISPVQACKKVKTTNCYPAPQIWVGWLITAIAVMLGAPFWFDVLNKVMVIRSTVKPHEKSPEEGSEDREDPGKGLAGSPAATITPVQSGTQPVAQGLGKPAPPQQASTEFIPHEWQDGIHNPQELPL